MELGVNVAAGLVVADGLAGSGGRRNASVWSCGSNCGNDGSDNLCDSKSVCGGQALSDIRSGRLSDMEWYVRQAVAGSMVGFLTGASGLLMTGASLWGVLALEFGKMSRDEL